MKIGLLDNIIIWACALGILLLMYATLTTKKDFLPYMAPLFFIELIAIGPILFKEKVTS